MTNPFNAISPSGRLSRSWFRLTREEQMVLAAIFFLFVLGAGVRAWRSGITGETPLASLTVESEGNAR